MTYVGFFLMIIGFLNMKSGDTGFMIASGFIIMAGSLGGRNFAIGATVLAVLLSAVHFFVGWLGVALMMVFLTGVLLYLMQFSDYGIPPCGYFVGKTHAIIRERTKVSFKWAEILNKAYQYQDESRYRWESPIDFSKRIANRKYWGEYIEFEIEEVICDLRFAKKLVVRVDLHRTIIYKTSRRVDPVKTQKIVEEKIVNFPDDFANAMKNDFAASVKCIDCGEYKASLIIGKHYEVVNSTVCVCGVYFRQVIDESGEAYFFPQSLFSPAAIA